MRILAIDLGDVRTGLAVGDDLTGIVQPLEVIEERDPTRRLGRLAREVEAYGPDLVLVGMPYNMDGSEGPRAKAARAFAKEFQAHTGVDTRLQDERLTSFAAEEHLKQSGRTHKQKRKVRDALAAVEILRDHLAGN